LGAVVNVAVLVWFALDPTSRHLEASAAEGTELEAEPRTA
jgi:hypothetical protein